MLHDACYNIDESLKYYPMWKKTDRKGHILCDSINIKSPK